MRLHEAHLEAARQSMASGRKRHIVALPAGRLPENMILEQYFVVTDNEWLDDEWLEQFVLIDTYDQSTLLDMFNE